MTNISPSTDPAKETRRLRTEFNFRRKHGEEGLAELMERANNYDSVNALAERFNVSPSRISQILYVLLGTPYHIWLAEHGVRRKRVTPPEEAK